MNNNKSHIAALLLICLFGVIINNSFFYHTHILSDSRVISHSHFYKNGFGSKNVPEEHKHSNVELEFIHIINSIFSAASVTVATVFILFSSFSVVDLFYSVKPRIYRIDPYNLRAPPAYNNAI